MFFSFKFFKMNPFQMHTSHAYKILVKLWLNISEEEKRFVKNVESCKKAREDPTPNPKNTPPSPT